MVWFQAVIAAAAGLGGALIGGWFAMRGAEVASRAAEQRESAAREHEKALRVRAERYEAIRCVYKVQQEVEKVVSNPSTPGKWPAQDPPYELHHRLWNAHGEPALVCSERLLQPLDDLVKALDKAYWEGSDYWDKQRSGTPLWKFLEATREPFKAAARDELEPLAPGFELEPPPDVPPEDRPPTK